MNSDLSLAEAQPLDLSQTKPVNMPISKSNAILIESGSASSCEQYLLDEMYHKNCDEMNTGMGELRLREDLADAMQESPGIRETGGRCVIVQMKPAVTKVVNPLGTVVNVHSDDDNEVESFEEDVIHENCDEALFRPFVASKTLAYQNKIKRYGDDIITRSLEGTTEVAVKVLKKTSEKKIKSRENSPAKTKKMTDIENSSKHSKVGNKTGLTKKNGSVNDLKQIDMSTTSSKIFKKKHAIEVDPVHHIDTTFTETKHIVLDLPPPLDNEDFFSLENVSKIENFEDAVDCEDTSIMISKKDKQFSSLREKICCEEKEKMTEEKSVTKKIRKPKIKLGVKIANINNENLNTEKTFEDCSAEISLPSIPKKTWSSVAASKSNEKSLIDSNEKENIRDLHPIEFVEEFTITLPRKPGVATAELIDINTPQEERAVKDETEKELLSTSDDVNLLKIDKSSDDEKGESSSSQAEVTESDDSGKVQDAPASEDMTQSKTITVSKSSRKKKKKNYLKFLN